MRLEFEPNATALTSVETETGAQNVSSDLEKLLRDGVKAAQDGKRSEARALLLQVTEADADNENAWLWLASISEYPEELLVFLNNVLRVNPENERALEWHRATRSLLSKTLVQRGIDALREERRDFAKQCFEQAIGHEADSELAWLWMASVADSEDEQASCFEKVLAINPENEAAATSLSQMRAAKTQGLFTEALKAALDGNHVFAVEALETALAAEPSHVDAWVLKAHIAPTFEERAESFLKLREIDPENEFAKAHLASWRALTEMAPRAEVAPVADFQAEPVEEAAASVEEAEAVTAEEPAAYAAEAPVAEYYETEVAEAAPVAEVPAEEPAAEPEFVAEQPAENVLSFSGYPQSVEISDFQPEAAVAEETFAEEAALEAYDEQPEAAYATETFAESNEAAVESYAAPAPAVEEAAAEPVEEFDAAAVDFTYDDSPAAETAPETAPEAAIDEEDDIIEHGVFTDESLHLSLMHAQDDKEAEDFFKNLTEVTELDRPEVPEAVAAAPEAEAAVAVEEEVAEPAAEPMPSIDDWRDSEPAMFVGGVADVPAAEEPIEEPVAGMPDVFQTVTEAFADAPAEAVAAPAEVAEPQPEYHGHHSHEEPVLCPFCTTQNEPNSFSCVTCQAVLTLSDIEMLVHSHAVDEELVARAVASLEAENESYGLDSEHLASLGIGHINLKHYREGYHFLQEAARLSPNNVVLEAQVNALAIRLSEIEEAKSAPETIGRKCRILVVDDSPTVRKLISGKLEKVGHDVICAVDGLDALAKINDQVPDLILLDITMPKLDGYQVCKMIRGNEATVDVPVVMISGKDGFFDKVRGKMAGTTGYITKPFGPETLMKTVETYLG